MPAARKPAQAQSTRRATPRAPVHQHEMGLAPISSNNPRGIYVDGAALVRRVSLVRKQRRGGRLRAEQRQRERDDKALVAVVAASIVMREKKKPTEKRIRGRWQQAYDQVILHGIALASSAARPPSIGSNSMRRYLRRGDEYLEGLVEKR